MFTLKCNSEQKKRLIKEGVVMVGIILAGAGIYYRKKLMGFLKIGKRQEEVSDDVIVDSDDGESPTASQSEIMSADATKAKVKEVREALLKLKGEDRSYENVKKKLIELLVEPDKQAREVLRLEEKLVSFMDYSGVSPIHHFYLEERERFIEDQNRNYKLISEALQDETDPEAVLKNLHGAISSIIELIEYVKKVYYQGVNIEALRIK